MSGYQRLLKRTFDILASAAGLLLLWPVLLVVALLVKLGSSGPVFFLQERIGRRFRPFRLYKFRTMVPDAPSGGRQITIGDDPRITWIGHWLRKTKVDELPQLFNVLKGDMSLVGPRPEVRRYVEMFRKEYEEVLRVRPGLTDMASLKYSDEATLLGMEPEPEEVYVRRVLPDKIRLAKKYVHHSSFRTDLGLVFLTLGRMFRFESSGQRDARAAAKSISDGNSGGHLVEGSCPPVQGEML